MVPRRILVAMLGVSVGYSQLLSEDYRMRAGEERARAEHESGRQLEAAYEARRASAHARLGSSASSIAPQAICPVFAGPSAPLRTTSVRSKGVIRPFVPRFAPRPSRSRWSASGPASESPASLFTGYISEQIVQARCINCHIEGGISGHTRIVFSPSSEADHELRNLAVFETFVSEVEGGVDTILAKIQGVGHGGGIQLPAGSAEFANMERFLRFLGGGISGGGVSPATLFDGVTMAGPARTLWRAALVFAGRVPTEAETAAVSGGSLSVLRRTVRGLLTGPRFHEFLLRAANDRLLTERHLEGSVLGEFDDKFPELVNKYWELSHAAYARGYEHFDADPAYNKWKRDLNRGVARAPLELIAHVVENDRPYSEILTADYIMANPQAANAYGASTEFDQPGDFREFRPSQIESYFRDDDSKVTEERANCCVRVISPGNLSTDYPHAGILNTTVFLRRYPSTATNRNRARSRWTYYHFLGVDIEKSASRTTDADALADVDNPTMKNSACTVCHDVLDPVAGAFQNYGDEGFYRDQWGGLDSLPSLYKWPEDGSSSPYQEGDAWYRDMREPGFSGELAPDPGRSVQWLARQIAADPRFAEATVKFWWSPIMGVDVAEPPEDERDIAYEGRLLASAAQAAEMKRLANGFRDGFAGGLPYNLKDLLVEIALSPWFRAESLAASDPTRAAALEHAGMERLLTPEELVRKTEAVTGYSWGRRIDGRGNLVNRFDDSWDSYRLLYGGIDSDGITTRAREVTPLIAAVAQSHAAEISCPIVLRELYLSPDSERLLFGGIDTGLTPHFESRESFEITAASRDSWQSVSTSVELDSGPKTIHLTFANAASPPDTRSKSPS